MEEHFFRSHKSATLFWASDSHTLLHVPFDCTQQDVESLHDSLCEDGDHEDDLPATSDYVGAKSERTSTDQQQSPSGQPKRETWRRLRFSHHYPRSGQATISIARYDGSNTELGGRLPRRWNSTLISPTHRPVSYCATDCQLAGDLSILLGLIAFCHSDRNAAIATINNWFPPSRDRTQWSGPASAETETRMQRMETKYVSPP